MSTYFSNHVSGVFDFREQAETVMATLIANGFARKSLHLIDKYAVLPTHVMKDSVAASLNELVLKDTDIHDAMLAGKIVVIAETQRLDERNTAQKIIQSVTGDCVDVI